MILHKSHKALWTIFFLICYTLSPQAFSLPDGLFPANPLVLDKLNDLLYPKAQDPDTTRNFLKKNRVLKSARKLKELIKDPYKEQLLNGIDVEYRGKKYKYYIGWGKDYETFPEAEFWSILPQSIMQLYMKFAEDPHLKEEIAGLTSLHDLARRPASGWVLMVDENGKVVVSLRLIKYEENLPIFTSNYTSMEKDIVKSFYQIFGANSGWTELFLESAPFVAEEKRMSATEVIKNSWRVKKLLKIADPSFRKLKRALWKMPEEFQEKYYDLLTTRKIPHASFFAYPDISIKESNNHYNDFKLKQLRDKRNNSFKRFEAQVHLLAMEGFPEAQKLLNALRKMYPKKYYHSIEMGRLYVDEQIGALGWMSVLRGFYEATKSIKKDYKYPNQVYGEIAPKLTNDPRIKRLKFAINQNLLNKLKGLGMVHLANLDAPGVESAIFIKGGLEEMRSNIANILRGKRNWVFDTFISIETLPGLPKWVKIVGFKRIEKTLDLHKSIEDVHIPNSGFSFIP